LFIGSLDAFKVVAVAWNGCEKHHPNALSEEKAFYYQKKILGIFVRYPGNCRNGFLFH